MKTPVFLSVFVFLAVVFLSVGAAPARAEMACDEILSTFRQDVYKADADFQKQASPVLVRIRKQRYQAIRAAAKTAIQRLESMAKTAEQKGDTATADQAKQALQQVENVRNSVDIPVPMSCVQLASYKGHQYLAVVDHISFYDARKACRRMGGHLAYIETRDELRFISKLITNAGGLCVGATDRQEEGKWFWLNGVPVEEGLWNSGEPNNWNNREYFAMTKRGKLNDVGRNESQKFFGFICEWEPGSRYAKIAPKIASALKKMESEGEFQELKISEKAADEFHETESGYAKKIGSVLKQFFASVRKANFTYQKKYEAIKKLQKKRIQLIDRTKTKALDCLDKQATSSESKAVENTKTEMQEFAQQAGKSIRVDELYRVRFQGSSYLNILSPVTWSQAQKMCSETGGHLVYIETMKELDFLSDTNLNYCRLWVGATDKHKELKSSPSFL